MLGKAIVIIAVILIGIAYFVCRPIISQYTPDTDNIDHE